MFLFTNACLMNKRTMAKGHICRKRQDRAVTCKHNLLDIFRIQHGLIKKKNKKKQLVHWKNFYNILWHSNKQVALLLL